MPHSSPSPKKQNKTKQQNILGYTNSSPRWQQLRATGTAMPRFDKIQEGLEITSEGKRKTATLSLMI